MGEMANLLGRVVAGKFKIEAPIGAGAMGEVYRARHTVLDTVIALKIMRPDIAKDAMFKERFYREARTASRLDHANSVRIYDYGVEPDGLVYIAMEFLHGRDLLSVLRDEWPLPDTRIVDILAQTLAAVSVAHELGIIHRDLKPENIMVSVGADDDDQRPYQVKVCDFGIAKLSDPRAFPTENNGSALTSSGTLIGTPEYMSPEQARGDALDPRSDLYSVGIILYQLLVGRVPFFAENALGVVLKQVTDEPVPPSRVRPGVNARLEAICLRALEKSRDDRYQTARDMRRDLRGVFGDRPQSLTDESGAHLLAAPPGRDGLDVSSARTLVQGETSTLRLGADGTPASLPIPIPISTPTPTPTPTRADVDFTSKHTSDGTEVTVPMSAGSRYLGLVAAVAVVALLVGGLGVLAIARSGSVDAAHAATLPSASPEGSVVLGNLPPGTAEPSPLVEPLALASASASASGSGSARRGSPAPKAGPPPAPIVAARAATTSAAIAPTAATTPPAAAAPPDYNPASAYVALGTLSPSGVREDAMRRKMGELLPKLSGCYRDALTMAASPIGGSAEIHMSIDDKGAIIPIVTAPKLPQFARCAQGVLSGQRIAANAVEGGSSGATASQWLTLHP